MTYTHIYIHLHTKIGKFNQGNITIFFLKIKKTKKEKEKKKKCGGASHKEDKLWVTIKIAGVNLHGQHEAIMAQESLPNSTQER